MSPRARTEQQRKARSLRRAKWSVRVLTAACVLVALGIGAFQLGNTGLATFLDRPAGVGATPDEEPQATAPKQREPQRNHPDTRRDTQPPETQPAPAPDDGRPPPPARGERGRPRFPDGRRGPRGRDGPQDQRFSNTNR